jgi:hypothetical protein
MGSLVEVTYAELNARHGILLMEEGKEKSAPRELAGYGTGTKRFWVMHWFAVWRTAGDGLDRPSH